MLHQVKNILLIFLPFWVLMISCGAPGQKDKDTFTTGEVYIVADESIEPLISTGVFNFENLNEGATINPIFLPEALAFQAFLSDSVQVIFAGRKLNEVEENYFEKKQQFPKYTQLATDAVALLLNKNNPDSLLTLKSLKGIFTGEITNWNQVSPDRASMPISLVFDHAGSGAITALKTYFEIDKLPEATFAVEKNQEVVEYISKNPGAIGILGNNWINNLNAVDLKNFRSKIQVGLVNTVQDPELFVRPEQTYIADSTYTFTRIIYAINREPRVGLGSGFASFMATDRGQRIVLKSGLLPYWMPPREILIHEN